MRCSASLQRLVRWAACSSHSACWTSLAEATSVAGGIQSHVAPSFACVSRRHLWQDGRLTNGGVEFSAEHFGRLDYPPSILGRELLVPSCAHAVLPGFSRLTPQGDLHEALEAALPSQSEARASPSAPRIVVDEGDVFEGAAAELPPPAPEPALECNTKRTYQPSNLVRKRRHGFLARLRTKSGRDVIARRQRKGRRKVTA